VTTLFKHTFDNGCTYICRRFKRPMSCLLLCHSRSIRLIIALKKKYYVHHIDELASRCCHFSSGLGVELKIVNTLLMVYSLHLDV